MLDRSRRTFLRTAAMAGAGFALPADRWTALAQGIAASTSPWAQADAIVARIIPTTFPNRTFDVTRYGAKPDGRTDCTAAIRSAIGACAASGGGRVLVPEGRFLTGAIHLESRVNLHVDAES